MILHTAVIQHLQLHKMTNKFREHKFTLHTRMDLGLLNPNTRCKRLQRDYFNQTAVKFDFIPYVEGFMGMKHQWLLDSFHKGPVMQKAFLCYRAILNSSTRATNLCSLVVFCIYGNTKVTMPISCCPGEANPLHAVMVEITCHVAN